MVNEPTLEKMTIYLCQVNNTYNTSTLIRYASIHPFISLRLPKFQLRFSKRTLPNLRAKKLNFYITYLNLSSK